MTDSPQYAANPRRLQKVFLDQLEPGGPFHTLFDHLAGISFFAKNRRFEIVRANRSFLERFGFQSEPQIVGKSDFDLFPKPLADKFRADDIRVMETGDALLNMVELFLNRQGIPGWFVTNKLPIRGRDGSVAGVMGTVQRYDKNRDVPQASAEIQKAVNLIHRHLTERITVADLARSVGLSLRQFDRKFKEAFNVTPQNYIMKTRIQAACDALRQPDQQVSDVALALGFYDQSAFTAQFRRHMGITPARYQKRYRLK